MCDNAVSSTNNCCGKGGVGASDFNRHFNMLLIMTGSLRCLIQVIWSHLCKYNLSLTIIGIKIVTMLYICMYALLGYWNREREMVRKWTVKMYDMKVVCWITMSAAFISWRPKSTGHIAFLFKFRKTCWTIWSLCTRVNEHHSHVCHPENPVGKHNFDLGHCTCWLQDEKLSCSTWTRRCVLPRQGMEACYSFLKESRRCYARTG